MSRQSHQTVSEAPTAPPWLSDEEREAERLKVLERTDLLGKPGDDLFDRFVRIASQIAGAEVSTITLVTADRLRFMAKVGFDPKEADRAGSFCDLAMTKSGPFVIEDASADPAYREVGLAHGYQFYAAMPLVVQGGHRIGSLCVYDPEPRTLSEDQRAALLDLAAVLAREIDTNHLAEIRADRAAAAKAASVQIEHQMRNMFAKVGAIVAMTAREDIPAEAVAQATRRRVLALSQANEVAIRHHFQPAPLAELLAAAVAPASEAVGQRPHIEGPALAMNSAAASVIVPLVDEVAHDSVRRGVLGDGGDVSLRWAVEEDRLVLRWIEAGVQADPDGDAEPFGSGYVRDGAPFALRGEARVEATADSLAYELRVPTSLVS